MEWPCLIAAIANGGVGDEIQSNKMMKNVKKKPRPDAQIKYRANAAAAAGLRAIEKRACV